MLLEYPASPDRDKLYFALGKTLVLADNMEEGRIYLGKLIEGWPDSRYAKDAKKLLAKDSVADIRKKEERRRAKEQARIDKRMKMAVDRMNKARKKQANIKMKMEAGQECNRSWWWAQGGSAGSSPPAWGGMPVWRSRWPIAPAPLWMR